ncbi:FXSXX-COOH protein [Streptomyces sp. NPDC005551]|uniref:FXSXX-COOH protein n=1 Tax=unclassified Streptomyces TaxID=2593676 RepID=UPI0033C51116
MRFPMNASLDAAAQEPGKAAAAIGPERVTLVRLASQHDRALSAAVSRVVSNGGAPQGPGRVAVAAFQSSV